MRDGTVAPPLPAALHLPSRLPRSASLVLQPQTPLRTHGWRVRLPRRPSRRLSRDRQALSDCLPQTRNEQPCHGMSVSWEFARQDTDMPWHGYTGRDWGQAVRQELVDLLTDAGTGVEEAERATREYAGALAAAIPDSLTAATDLADAVPLVDAARQCPPDWLLDADLGDLLEMAAACRTRAGAVQAQRDGLEADYLAIPESEPAARFVACLRAARAYLQEPDVAVGEQSIAIESALRSGQAASEAARDSVNSIAPALGLDPSSIERPELGDFVAAMNALSASVRPPSEWLSPRERTRPRSSSRPMSRCSWSTGC